MQQWQSNTLYKNAHDRTAWRAMASIHGKVGGWQPFSGRQRYVFVSGRYSLSTFLSRLQQRNEIKTNKYVGLQCIILLPAGHAGHNVTVVRE